MNAEKPLRILHVCPRPSFSGLESYALMMAEAQKKLGHVVEFLTLEDSPLEAKVRAAGLANRTMSRSPFAKLQLNREMVRLFASGSCPDIVHLHSTQDINSFLTPMTFAKMKGEGRPKFILQIHIWISHSKKDPLHAIAYSLLDEVWCSSEPAKSTLERFLPISKSKIRIVSYGRDIENLNRGFLSREEARKKLGISPRQTVIGSVARIDEGKGIRELFEATLSLLKDHDDLALVWIGPPTSDDPKAVAFGEEIMGRVNSLPKEFRSRVFFPGAVPESYRVLKAFDLFALPSYSECFALSLLEAQAAGLPTLGTNSGGTPAVVREGETGWLFEPRSISTCRTAIERALSERNRWQEYGRTAQTQVRTSYDSNRILPQTIQLYRALLLQ